jgi:tetratricopeptide (TPR) repeat protein
MGPCPVRQPARGTIASPVFINLLAGAENNLGHALLSKDNVDEAIPHLKKMLVLGPETAQLHKDLGAAPAEKGQIDEAIPHFDHALQIAPYMVEAHSYLVVPENIVNRHKNQ